MRHRPAAPIPAGLPALALCAAALLAGCERPDHIEIDPRMPRLTRKGETVRLHGKLMDRGGRIYPTERPAWSSRDPFVAAVGANGEVAALSSGHTVVTAKWNELTATVPVEVDLVEAVVLEPAALEVRAEGEPARLKVVALDREGHPQKDRQINVVSLDPQVARVDSEGKVWGLAPGKARVQARIDDKATDAAVTVLPAGPEKKQP